MKNRYRSRLKTAGATAAVLAKIKTKHIVFEVGQTRFDARACTGVVIDEAAADDNIVFTRPGGSSAENYDLADVVMIKRLRSRKWLIQISGAANPAEVV